MEKLINAIKTLKEKKKAIILAHNYQKKEIYEVADFIGDSLELSLKARDAKADILIVCGVSFMAETAKILNPKKRVFTPVPDAGCPLADFLTPKIIEEAKKEHPDAAVVVYVNSSAECKAMADITCTSGNAVKVVKSLKEKVILFGPDSNLANFVAREIPTKTIIPIPSDGHCPIHIGFTKADVDIARKTGGKIIVHPECYENVQMGADYVVSTGKMAALIEEDQRSAWHIFTENGMIDRLKLLHPDVTYYGRKDAICADMKKISLSEVKNCLENLTGEMIIDQSVIEKAQKSVNKMLEVS